MQPTSLLDPGAGEQGSPVPWVSRVGAESGHTAGVTVAVPRWNAHDAAHGHTSCLIWREKQRGRGHEQLTGSPHRGLTADLEKGNRNHVLRAMVVSQFEISV